MMTIPYFAAWEIMTGLFYWMTIKNLESSMSGRIIVIGDIHGCYGELLELCDKLAVASDDIIVSVGDLVDRGPQPVEVVQFFRARPNSMALIGNHERKHIRGVFSYSQEITRLQFGDGYADAVRWMENLPYCLEFDDAIVVHAAVEPGVALADQKREILCGSTSGARQLGAKLGEGQWWEQYDGAKPVIFGHHVVDEPLVRPGRIYGLDTGACHGGWLTALVLPDFELCSVRAREDHWRAVRRDWQADVLAAKPWREMNWPDLDDQIARFDWQDEPRTQAFVAALREWRTGLAARMTEVFDRVHDDARRIAAGEVAPADVAKAAKAHPLAGIIFQCLHNRLDMGAFQRQCRTPRKLAEFSAALGAPPLDPPKGGVRD
jgi:serine/threonine protein phosphatase 1